VSIITNAASAEAAAIPRNEALGFEMVAEAVPVLTQYLRIVKRWRKLIAGVILLCVLTGLVVTLLMPSHYTATATLEIARETDRITPANGVEQDVPVNDLEFYQTQYGLLKSHSLAERVASALKLQDDPAFFELFSVELKDAGSVGTNGRYGSTGRPQRLRKAADMLLENVRILPISSSSLVDIRFTSPDPQLSARVANRWGEEFITSNLERRFDANAYARRFLEGRLVDLKAKLAESEKALVGAAETSQIVTVPRGGTAAGEPETQVSLTSVDLEALNEQLNQAIAERIRAQNTYRQASGTSGLGSNPVIAGLRQRRADVNTQLSNMLVNFDNDYPPVIALRQQIASIDNQIAQEQSRNVAAARAAYLAAQSNENELHARVSGLRGQMLDERRNGVAYTLAQREVDTNRELYSALLQRYKEVGVAGGVGTNNASFADRARVPQQPSSPILLLNLGLALLAGLGIASILTFALEQVDETVTDPVELERELGLPALGTVPHADKDINVAELDPKASTTEAYLAIHTRLTFATDHGFPKSVSVTSTRSGEGKSTTSIVLASVMARMGFRAVLVDGDLRSPSVHSSLGVRNKLGLSNYLASQEDVASVLQSVASTPNLTVITAGPAPINAAELLASPRLAQLVSELGERFDCVIIDSPPLLGLADAPLIGQAVEATVFVVRAHEVRRSQIRIALARLRGTGAHVVGAVLTHFDESQSYYGYGYDYGYSYGYGDEGLAKSRSRKRSALNEPAA
jgi:succinoglycan biosynthesis transport protein ExoP